jgi:hypothetical protein
LGAIGGLLFGDSAARVLALVDIPDIRRVQRSIVQYPHRRYKYELAYTNRSAQNFYIYLAAR